MTLALSTRRSGPYTATGGQTAFDFAWPIRGAADLVVTRRRAGADTVLAYPGDYTLAPGAIDNPLGGQILLVVGALAGDEILIEGHRAAVRTTAFADTRKIGGPALNTEFDHVQTQLQELGRTAARSLPRDAFADAYQAGGRRLGGLGAPVAAADAATKAYVMDTVSGGVMSELEDLVTAAAASADAAEGSADAAAASADAAAVNAVAAASAQAAAEGSAAAAEAARDASYANARAAPTWTVLSGITTGLAAGERGEVLGPDSGTHADATATGYDGSTVPNEGIYAWNDTWSRWQRIGASTHLAALEPPAYENVGGQGNRTSLITVTATAGLLNVATPASNLVDGGVANNNADSAAFNAVDISAHAITFSFSPGRRFIITEATWQQSGAHTHGSWQWHGVEDDGTEVAIGAAFTLGGSTSQAQSELRRNTRPFNRYRLKGVSGTASAGPYVQEVTFRIARAVTDTAHLIPPGGLARQAPIKRSGGDYDVAWHAQAGDLFAGLPAAVVNLWTFDDPGETTTIADSIGSADITLLSTGTPTYEYTAQGLKIRSGVAEAPSDSVRGAWIVYRVKRNEAAGFVTSGGPAGSGSGIYADSVSSGYTYHLAGGYGLHTLMRRLSDGTNAFEVNRGGWTLAFEDYGSVSATKLGIGGRHSTTTFRCADIEVAAAGRFNAALSDDDRRLIYRILRRALKPRGIYLHIDDCPMQADLVILHGESNPHGDEVLANFAAGDQALTFTNVFVQNVGSTTTHNNQAAPAGLVLGLNNRLTDQSRAGAEVGLAKRWRANWLTRRRDLFILEATLGSAYMAPSGSGSALVTNTWHASEAAANGLFNIALMRGLYDIEQVCRSRGIGLRLAGVGQNIGLNDAMNTAHTTDAATYQGLRQDFFAKLQLYTGLDAVHAVIARTHSSDPASNATALSHVRTAEADLVAANASSMVLVDTDAYGKQAGDAAHFNAAGTMALGEAIYDQLNSLGRFG